MSFEDFDNRAREAADQHRPAFEEKAWERMESLLDQQMPEKKDRRRFLFFILLAALLLGGGGYLLLSPTQTEDLLSVPPSQQVGQDNVSVTPPASESRESADEPASESGNINNVAATDDKTGTTNSSSRIATPSGDRPLKKVDGMQGDKIRTAIPNTVTDYKPSSGSPVRSPGYPNDQAGRITGSPEDRSMLDDRADDPLSLLDRRSIEPASLVSISDLQKPISEQLAANSKPDPVVLPSIIRDPLETRKGFVNNFALTFSAGADISAAGLQNPGTVTPTYGAGLRYQFAPRLAVRTGFYVARKKYSAGPDEYHPPKGYWTYYYDLKNVDADCKVFQVPLNIDYTLANTRRGSWFISGGLSTYFMKREVYDYTYLDQVGQTQYKTWQLNNGKKHYFSVLNLSGGYQYQIGRRFSLLAEPYIQVPLDGIGFGNIHLNSAGLLLTLSVKPFARR